MLKDIYIPEHPLNQTPLIDFKTSGELKIMGKSFPEDPVTFYEPLIEWIQKLKNNCPQTINMTVKLDYFNTSTSKLLLLLFKRLEDIFLSGKSKIKITWLYNKNDEDQLDSGIDYESIIEIPFELVEY